MKKSWLAALIVLPLVILGWWRLRLETDILATLPGGIPEVRALKLLRDGFAGGSDLVIALEAEDDLSAEEAMTALAEGLQKRTDLVKEVRWAQPMAQQAQSGAALLAWSLQNADPAKLRALKTRLEGAGAEAQFQKSLQSVTTALDAEKVQRASYDPLGLLDCLDTSAASALEGSLFGLVSEDGAFRMLLVTPAESVGNYKSAAAWLEKIKAEVQTQLQTNFPDQTQPTVRYTGEPAFQAEIGAGIEKDMSSTIGLTEVLIAILFWIMFRRLKPLMWIQGLLMLSMVITLGVGGLLVGKLSIMSLGFAAIVLGIIVDYAVLIIQEARQHPQEDAKTLRKMAAPGIIAGACTTATVFLSLLFSGLPGLAELGLLVALGVLVGLGVMLTFAPILAAGKQPADSIISVAVRPVRHLAALVGTVLLFGSMTAIFLTKGLPVFQTSAEALRPTNSESMDTFQWMQERMGRENEASLPVLITGPVTELQKRTEDLAQKLDAAVKAGSIVRHALPTMLVGSPTAQLANREVLQWIIQEQPRFEKAADAAGFTESATALLRGLTSVWKEGQATWPQDESTAAAMPILSRLIATGNRAKSAGMADGEGVVLASVNIPGKPGLPDREKLAELQRILSPDTGAWVAGWETLGGALSSLVQRDLNRQLIPICLVLALTLLITFRNVKDLLLSTLLLGGGLGALAATMSALGIGWNLASLAAIPLLLGTGIDYGIHLLLALKKSGNDIHQVQATTGRAVFFSGMTTVIGFSSLFFAGNRGISSLGLACCVGTIWILLIVLWLLPHWRAWLKA
ncbi:MAG: MMPL family transporter [Verrucomicrobia bacterium]|nr:MMPL family transporter [Verrucomicrobiota bacterium]